MRLLIILKNINKMKAQHMPHSITVWMAHLQEQRTAGSCTARCWKLLTIVQLKPSLQKKQQLTSRNKDRRQSYSQVLAERLSLSKPLGACWDREGIRCVLSDH